MSGNKTGEGAQALTVPSLFTTHTHNQGHVAECGVRSADSEGLTSLIFWLKNQLSNVSLEITWLP